MAAPVATRGALQGLRILDLSRVLAGPLSTMLLADMGAEVIKIERPKIGDETRAWGPPFVGPESAYFLCVNRNKKSVCVDMAHPQGAELLQKLACMSDVVVENFLPGKLASYGLDYSTLSKLNPKLVYCSITGYGSTGPYADRAGYDIAAQAIGGLMSITGDETGTPTKVGVAVTDVMTGLFAHGAIMAALLARNTTGVGQHVDCSLLDSQLAGLVNIASNVLNTGVDAKRYGNGHASIVPYQVFRAADKGMVVCASNDGQFRALCKEIDRPDLAADPKYATNAKRVANRKELIATLQALFETKPCSEWVPRLAKAGLAVAPVNGVKEAFEDPQVLHREMVKTIQHPTAGAVKVTGHPVKFSDTPCSIRLPQPTLGQHTDDVLTTLLGMTSEEVAQARTAGWVA